MKTTTNPHGLYQKGGTGNWFLPITVNGKRTVKSTGTSDLREAVRKVPELTALAHADLTSPVPSSQVWTLGKAFDEFIAAKERAKVPHNSLNNYRSVKNTIGFSIPLSTKLTSLTRDLVNEFVDTQIAKGRKQSSIRGCLVVLLTVLRFAAEADHYHGNPKKLVDKNLMRKPAPRKRFLSSEEIAKLLEHSQPHHRDYVLGYLYTGCRKTELFEIRPEHVDLQSMKIHIPGEKTDASDGTIALAEPLKPILQKRLEETQPGQPLFPALRDINKSISRAAERAGIAHTTCHDLRRTTGSILASENVSLQIVAKVLRQKDIGTTSRTYAHLYSSVTNEAVAKLPSFGAGGGATSDVRKTRQSKIVVQMDKGTGEEIARFQNLTEAARATGIASNKIGDVCAGRAKSAGGFRWSFLVASEVA